MAEPDSSSKSDSEEDALANDPFFRLPTDSDWNACIGKQGSEENYLDGYIQAATALVEKVIDEKMYEKRDTVVLPILYNARHAVELSLKFSIDRLVAAGVLPAAPPRNHDILAHWKLLNDADLGDEEIRQHVRAMGPFVTSLARIDNDGQELRYHLDRDEDPSLSTYSLANLEVVRDSLAELSEIISGLKYRIIDFIDERRTSAYTDKVSRRDLMCIAKTMPPLSRWNEPIFDLRKTFIRSRFNLSGNQFSEAINIVKGNREMKCLLGQETSLLYLPDHMIIWIIEQWRKLHPPAEDGDAIVRFDNKTIEDIMKGTDIRAEVVTALQKRLTDQQLAEIEAIFYLGRDGWFPEEYEDFVEATRKQHAMEKDNRRQISHLLSKMNFVSAVTQALLRLGRPSLATLLSRV